MIIPSKWFPSVQPRYDFQTVVFDKAVEKVQEDYKLAIEAHKVEMKIEELEVELYNKKARVNQLELAMFTNRKLDLYA
jgi:vacuolar-type H+-ATPase subunit D/Vma8